MDAQEPESKSDKSTAIPGTIITSASAGAVLPPGGLRKRESSNPSQSQSEGPPEIADDREDRKSGKLSIMYDLYVDLLGSLVPGLFTVILGGGAVILTLSTVHAALFKKSLLAGIASGGLKDVIAGLHWEIGTIITVSSYVIGSVFFRQDPKKPDAVSALSVWMNSRKEERNGLAVQHAEPLPPELSLKDSPDRLSLCYRIRSYFLPTRHIQRLGLDTQFPYLHLRCYLAARGLTHLLYMVPWCPKEEKTKGFRTKMFVNILKIRLHSLFPEMSREIIRNEAHVRLATSVWYASTILIWLSIVVLFVLFFVGRTCIINGMASSLYVSSSFGALLFIFCVVMHYYLRKCIHYMRVREVVYVLETAHLAEATYNVNLFDGLSEKTKLQECIDCNR